MLDVWMGCIFYFVFPIIKLTVLDPKETYTAVMLDIFLNGQVKFLWVELLEGW